MKQPHLLEIPDQGEPAKPLVTASMPEEGPALKQADQSGSAGVDDGGCGSDDRGGSQGPAIRELAGG